MSASASCRYRPITTIRCPGRCLSPAAFRVREPSPLIECARLAAPLVPWHSQNLCAETLALANCARGQSLLDLEEPVPGIAFQESQPMPDIIDRIVVGLEALGHFIPIDRSRDRGLRHRP